MPSYFRPRRKAAFRRFLFAQVAFSDLTLFSIVSISARGVRTSKISRSASSRPFAPYRRLSARVRTPSV